MSPSPDPAEVLARLDAVAERASILIAEGLPFPTEQISLTVRQALDQGDVDGALTVVKRAESLYARSARDWTWVRELLQRAEEMRALAQSIGVDLAPLERRVGNARDQLRSSPLSGGSLEKAAASASAALAVLSDSVPKYCVQEGQRLGATIRSARDRGEDVTEATTAFRTLLSAIHEEHLPLMANQLVEVRRVVGRIPKAPAVAALPTDEEEEILLEARNLARRLNRIKGHARDASSAARLMHQVRAALSEDRRYGTPEEEIEALWTEVDRLTKERRPPETLAPPAATPEPPAEEVAAVPPALPEPTRSSRPSEVPVPVAPPAEEPTPVAEPTSPSIEPPVETRRRPRAARAARP